MSQKPTRSLIHRFSRYWHRGPKLIEKHRGPKLVEEHRVPKLVKKHRLTWHHPNCTCSDHADTDINPDCKCSYHADINHTTLPHAACPRDRVLTNAESDRRCLDMGCQQIVWELNSRLGTTFELRNSYVTLSLQFCMYQDLDFGTAFAYFMAAGVKECTNSLSCCVKATLQNRKCSGRITFDPFLPDNWDNWCWSQEIRPYHVFGTHPDFEEYVATITSGWEYPSKPQPCSLSGDFHLGYIPKPYESLPRRLWDVHSNRVIPTELLTLKRCKNGCTPMPGMQLTAKFWAISHSWTEEMVAASPSVHSTRINGKAWPVPIPHGVSLDDVRTEILGLIGLKKNAQPRTTLYCWLDILCLRQQGGGDRSEKLRTSEWRIDVPTIGQTYRISEGVIQYFNGLGKPFSSSNWDSKRHWWNRAWTLQEIRDENDTLIGGIYPTEVRPCALTTLQEIKDEGETGGIYSIEGRALASPTNFNVDIQGVFQGQTKRLADVIAPLRKIAKDCASTDCSVLELIQEMRRRNATSDIDKIAGLSFLLLSEKVPQYSNAKTPEEAWLACLLSLRYTNKLELLYNFPFVRSSGSDELGLDDILWTPTWSQIIRQPTPISFYDRPVPSTKAQTASESDSDFNAISFYDHPAPPIEAHTVGDRAAGSTAAAYKSSTSLPTPTEPEPSSDGPVSTFGSDFASSIWQPAPTSCYGHPNLSSESSSSTPIEPESSFSELIPILGVWDAFSIEECEILEGTYVRNEKEEYIKYTVHVNPPSKRSWLGVSHPGSVFEFCSPKYRVDDGVGTQNCDSTHIVPPILELGKYILVTHSLNASSGWVIGRRREVHPKQAPLMRIIWSNHKVETTTKVRYDDGMHIVCDYVIEKVGVVNTEDVGRLKKSGCLSRGMKCYFV